MINSTISHNQTVRINYLHEEQENEENKISFDRNKKRAKPLRGSYTMQFRTQKIKNKKNEEM